MGLFDGLKQSVEDAKAELEAKAKEVQDKLNPVNALQKRSLSFVKLFHAILITHSFPDFFAFFVVLSILNQLQIILPSHKRTSHIYILVYYTISTNIF